MNPLDDNVQMIPIARITILNPRTRNKALFHEIVANISEVGLKRPITVSQRLDLEGAIGYNLVCGQGRLEAYAALGQAEIPAIVVEADQEECFLMSLVENLARRQRSPMELVEAITELKERGYTAEEIAAKIGRHKAYVYGVLNLLERGEERLIREVEADRMPITIAVAIAGADDAGIRQALTEAYENKSLRGNRLKLVRRIIAQRKASGKRVRAKTAEPAKPVSVKTLLETYRRETDRQKLVVKRATLTQNRLLTIVTGLQALLQDEHFRTVLRAETMDTMPPQLAERIAAFERN